MLKQCGDTPLFKVQKIGGTDTENLHRNMLYPFINAHKGERMKNCAGDVVSELPAKSLSVDLRADNLKCANYFMDTFFDEDW